jgi:hypothetical protein
MSDEVKREEPEAVELMLHGDTEDVCRYCGDHIAYAPPPLHRGVCEKKECRDRGKIAGRRRVRRFYGRGR